MPEQFQGTNPDYDRLRRCLAALGERGVSSQNLLKASGSNASRSTLDRFKAGITRTLNENLASLLWVHIRDTHTAVFRAPSLPPDAEDEDLLSVYLTKFFDLKTPRIEAFASEFSGRYVCYTLSELFFDEERVTVSDFSIEQSSGGRLIIRDVHFYKMDDATAPMTEEYAGICVPKGTSRIFITAETTLQRPRIYFVNQFMPDKEKGSRSIQHFQGFLVSSSNAFGGYFHSNFFCRRLNVGETIKKDIVERGTVTNELATAWLFRKSQTPV